MIRLVGFISWRLAENARTRRRSLPRRSVVIRGASVTLRFRDEA